MSGWWWLAAWPVAAVLLAAAIARIGYALKKRRPTPPEYR
ncbi:hypothetical protein GCM10014713_41510 [Streptomyces purpureus]|uniref:Uncharacterized protein n=1 Tax=Streptomyces purpureus TaxID=1951 RepID=A0A918H7B6_9ACTN|nr:hypothetical protein GCM10014713_41510 [Streptomyces purpureus]